MAYNVVLRRNGAKVGHFGPFTTKKQAIAQGQVLADDSARDVVVSVEPQRKKATTKRKNTRRARKNAHPRTEAEIRADHRVESMHRESDGFCDKTRLVDGRYRTTKKNAWWLYLRSGYSTDEGSGIIHECTLKEVGAVLSRVTPSARKNTRRTRKNGPTRDRPHYPFAEKETQYARYTDAQLYHAMNDAMAASRAQQGWNEAGSSWYLDDYHTIVKEIQKRKRAKKRTNTRRTRKNSDDWIKREGKLGGPGYTEKPARTRHMLLNRSMKGYGYRSTLGSLQVLLLNSHMSSKDRKVIEADKKWLMAKYGGKGSFTKKRSNPASKSILKRIALANKWIAFARKHDIRGIDTSSTWHSSLTYTHPIQVSAGKNRATVKYTDGGKKQSESYNLNDTDTYSDTGVSAVRYAINTYIIKPIKRGAKEEGKTIPASLR